MEIENQIGQYVRAGIIPYTIDNNGKLYFLLGIDEATGELTDFGGGVKQDENVFQTAHREFIEESCNVFDNVVTVQDIKNSPVIINGKRNSALFFVRVNNSWLEKANVVFINNRKKVPLLKKYFEMSDIMWLSENNFVQIVFDSKCKYMWSRIQNIIRRNTTWEELKLRLKSGELITLLNKNLIESQQYEWRTCNNRKKQPLVFNWKWKKRERINCF